MGDKKKQPPASSTYDDIKKLIDPIAGDSPVGPYIRYDALFDDIATARTQEDANLPQGVWEREIKHANWPEVVKLCQDFLSNNSKDLQIAAWLMQAWYYTKSLKGLTQGLHLFNQLCINYWEQIHPHSTDDEETIEARCNLINWIDEKLSSDLHRFQITKPENPKIAPFNFGDSIRFANPSQSTTNSNLMSAFKQSQAETAVYFYQQTISDTTLALEELKNLESTLDLHIDSNLISLTQTKNTLKAIQNLAETQYEKRTKEEADKKQTTASKKLKEITKLLPKAVIKEPTAPPASNNHGPKEIYQQLEKIVADLKKLHPQSPAPYLVKKAISLDQQSLQEWLQDVTHHKLELLSIQKWLGILP